MPEVVLNLLNPAVVTARNNRGFGGGPATIVGGNDCLWTNDGDASYIEVASDSGGSGTVHFDVEQLDIPASATVTSARFEYVAKENVALSEVNFHIDWAYGGVYGIVGTTDYQSTVASLTFSDVGAAFIDDLRAGTGTTDLSSNGFNTTVRLTQAQWRIAYTTAGGASFIRHRQRGDGFGMSSAPRAFQNSTQQASLRNFGTY